MDPLCLGSSREDNFIFFWGGGNTLLSGARGDISCHQQSIKGGKGGKGVCRELTANEGGSFKNVSEPYGEIRQILLRHSQNS